MEFVFAVLGVWLLSVVISDCFNQFVFGRFIRGSMKPIFCACWCLFYAGVLLRDFRLLLYPPIGAVLAAIQNYIMPQSYTVESLAAGGYEAVAFGLAPIVIASFAALGLWLYRRHRLWAALCYICSAVVLAIVGAPRNTVGIALLSCGVIVFIWWTRGGKNKRFKITFPRLIGIAVLGLIGGLAVFYLYQYGASKGFFGEQQLRKYAEQSEQTVFGASPLGVLLAGRPQIFGAMLGIMDQPILGFGSWTAWEMTDYFYEAMEIVGSNADVLNRLSQGAVAGVGHSIVLVAWLENGLLAFVTMLAIYCTMLRGFISTIELDSRITPLIVGGFFAFTWAFLFSPFDPGARNWIGFFCALYVMDFPNMLYAGRPQVGRNMT